MTTIFAPTALLPGGWANNVLIEYDKDGWIIGVDTDKRPPAGTETAQPGTAQPGTAQPGTAQPGTAQVVQGPLLPGMGNLHSHAFQRAMAGLAERASGKKDTFWGWRETMYRFLDAIGPEEMGAIAAQVFVEMLKAGYTGVAEFHYVHHQQSGAPYEDRALLSRHVIQSAVETGIAITHLPVLYAYSGFGEKAPAAGQTRFINTTDQLLRMVEELQGAYRNLPQVTIGMALHSLRAVSPDMLQEAVAGLRGFKSTAPIHMHIAEQMREVEGCIEWSGKRPVAWLLENANVDPGWCLVHATHMTDQETKDLAASGAVVGICPTTEANLGDGIFPLSAYFEAGGVFGIGSDSHVSINLFEELRWMEYTQRLLRQERTVISDAEIPSVGGTLFDRTVAGGAQALGRKTGRIEIGHRADFLVLDMEIPVMTGKLRDHILDAAIFATNENPVRDVMVGGRWVVKNRHHKREEDILRDFRRAMKKLQA